MLQADKKALGTSNPAKVVRAPSLFPWSHSSLLLPYLTMAFCVGLIHASVFAESKSQLTLSDCRNGKVFVSKILYLRSNHSL